MAVRLRRQGRRREAMVAFALANGFGFARSDPMLTPSYPFHLFTLGQERGGENVATREWNGLTIRAADFWYRSQATRGRPFPGSPAARRPGGSIVVVDMPWDPPRIRIERATIGSEIAERLGVHPIPFESDRFNRFEIGEGALLVHAPLRDPGSLITLLWIAKGFVDRIPNLVRRTYGGMDAPIPQGFPISWPETGG